jgi:hypothetical protein
MQNKESVALWPSLLAFMNTFVEDKAVHIVEGVALLPNLVSQVTNSPRKVIYVGNTNPKHYQSMLDFANQNPDKSYGIIY